MAREKNKCVGLIITDQSLSAVEVEMTKNGPSVTNYSKILLEQGIVAHGCVILNKESFQEAVKKVLSKGIGGPINTHEILVSLPEERVFSHSITIPKEKINDNAFIRESAKDLIPIELDKAIYDYKVIYETSDNKSLVLSFAAAQKTVVDGVIQALKELKLKVANMNVDINCLIRSFDNRLNKSEGDFLLISLNMDRDVFAVNSEETGITKIISEANKEEQVEKIRALQNLSNKEKVREMLVKLKTNGTLSEEQKAGLIQFTKPYLDSIEQKIRQVVSAAEARKPSAINSIYLAGLLSCLPGVEERVAALLPGIPIKKGVQYTEVPAEIEEDALQGIGLCLAESMEKDKTGINLLPQHKKDELNLDRISPKLKVLSSILAFVLIMVSLQMSFRTASNYLQLRITSQEIALFNQQALNPYKTEMAKIKQQKKLNDEQILSLLGDSAPVSQIIRDIDKHNANGITLVNLNYTDLLSSPTSELTIRARSANRSETEKFIEELEENPFYIEVESPLSNLVGRGERFISVGLKIDKEKVLQSDRERIDAEEEVEQTRPKPSNPKLEDDA